MCRSQVGVFQNPCFWVWSPAGSHAVDWVVWPISALVLDWLLIPQFGSVHGGSQPLIRLHNHPRLQVLRPAGVLGVCVHPGAFCLCAQAAGPPIRLRAHPEFQLWAPSPLIWVLASWASGERWGCFSVFTVPGLSGEGRQRPGLMQRVL